MSPSCVRCTCAPNRATPPLLECVAAWLRGCVAAWRGRSIHSHALCGLRLDNPALWSAAGVLRVAVPLKCGRDSCMHVIFRHVRAIELGLRRAVVVGLRRAGALTAVINRTDNAGDYAPAPESGHKDRSTSFCTDAPEPNRVQKLHTHEARHSCEHFQNHVPSQHSAHRSCRARVQSSCYPISGPKMPPYRSYTAELYVYPDACSESSHPAPACDHVRP
jgi:hypothetical protein